ncbi:unnamed protein product [Adineta steineri]|uniref:Uncharacterized protein n=1 Tax=Adineta steineri TaxID=433720 RepID=A0A818FYA2_9BILA|nr:unnamed protein product [Adineta steineri]
MFVDDQVSPSKNTNDHATLFPPTLKQNIVEQAASMLVQHINFNKKFYHPTQNSNGNAFDEYRLSLNHIQQKKKVCRRTKKCNSWLSKNDTSLNRLPILIKSPISKHELPGFHTYPSNVSTNKSYYRPSKIHPNQITLSSNAVPNINNDIYSPMESVSQPLIMIHKKRVHRDNFLSTMQNCIQPPYSQNHFYAFDQINMLKLQRNFHKKRKYSEDDRECNYSEIQFDQTSKKYIASPLEQSLPKTADHISINKYDNERKNSLIFEQKPEFQPLISKQKSDQSELILSHLEKILNLCGELRTLAKDVEIHLNEQTTLKTISIEINEKDHTKEYDSEQTIIDIYKELENQQINNEKDFSLLPYEHTHDTLSIHSESNKSIQLMQTESFKTKSPSLTASHTKLRKSEDICTCFLNSFLEKQNCKLNTDEQEYLNELTKAYVLGREQILKEQQEANNKFQAFLNETIPEESDEPSSLIYDTNNNNQSNTPINSSSVILHNNSQFTSTPHETSKSNTSLISSNQQLSSIQSEMISIKHQIFINEPIAMKATNILPGIGIKYAHQLDECGFSTVRRLLGFYLLIKNDQNFVNWLNNNIGISMHSAWLCTNALRAWCQVHL